MSRDDVPSDENGRPAPVIAPEMQPCPKCRGEMVEGWIPKANSDSGTFTVTGWQPGSPRMKEIKAFFGYGTVRLPLMFDLKKSLPISAYRCVRCGYLDFYARPLPEDR